MLQELDFLRELNIWSVMLRLTLAMIFGGLIGLERGKKGRAAGFRTYMVVCLGAALTIVLGQYEGYMLTEVWKEVTKNADIRADVSRFGAQVINGIGFLGAGTVIATNQQKVKGLTTASGLWASACLGLVIGAGFYEAAFFAFLIILATMWLLRPVEEYFIERSRNLNIYVEVRSMGDLGEVLRTVKEQGISIFDMDIHHGKEQIIQKPNAVLYLRMPHRRAHHEVVALLSDLEEVYAVKEL